MKTCYYFSQNVISIHWHQIEIMPPEKCRLPFCTGGGNSIFLIHDARDRSAWQTKGCEGKSNVQVLDRDLEKNGFVHCSPFASPLCGNVNMAVHPSELPDRKGVQKRWTPGK